MWTPEKINANNAEKLSRVKPLLAEKCRRLIALAAAEKYILLVTQGFRTIAEQNELYAEGRTKPGKIVTNAKGGQSNHNFGTAVDFAFVVNGNISWDENLYQNIGRWAKICGLNWGGNWKKFVDKCHVEL